MITPSPAQSTPAGCFIGVVALFPLAVASLGAYGLYRWRHLPLEKRHFDERFWLLLAALGGGLLVAAALIMLSKKLLGSLDFKNYDPKDPDEPTLKF